MIHLHTDSWLCYGILKQQCLRVHDAVCARGEAGSSIAITMDTLRKPQVSFGRVHRTIWNNSRLCGSHIRKVQRLSLHSIWHASQRCLSNPTSENHPSVNLWQVGVCLLFGFTGTATQLMLRRSSVSVLFSTCQPKSCLCSQTFVEYWLVRELPVLRSLCSELVVFISVHFVFSS